MKRLFLLLVMLASFAGHAFSQTSPEPKLLFASKVNELEAGLSRNKPQIAAEAYADLAVAMQQRLVALRSADPTRAANAEKVYNTVKQQANNMQQNRQSLVQSLRSFMDFY